MKLFHRKKQAGTDKEKSIKRLHLESEFHHQNERNKTNSIIETLDTIKQVLLGLLELQKENNDISEVHSRIFQILNHIEEVIVTTKLYAEHTIGSMNKNDKQIVRIMPYHHKERAFVTQTTGRITKI